MNSARQRFLRLKDYLADYAGNSGTERRARRMAVANAWARMDANDRRKFSY